MVPARRAPASSSALPSVPALGASIGAEKPEKTVALAFDITSPPTILLYSHIGLILTTSTMYNIHLTQPCFAIVVLLGRFFCSGLIPHLFWGLLRT